MINNTFKIFINYFLSALFFLSFFCIYLTSSLSEFSPWDFFHCEKCSTRTVSRNLWERDRENFSHVGLDPRRVQIRNIVRPVKSWSRWELGVARVRQAFHLTLVTSSRLTLTRRHTGYTPGMEYWTCINRFFNVATCLLAPGAPCTFFLPLPSLLCALCIYFFPFYLSSLLPIRRRFNKWQSSGEVSGFCKSSPGRKLHCCDHP